MRLIDADTFWIDVCDGRINNVTAWQPLPEPFKESEEENGR